MIRSLKRLIPRWAIRRYHFALAWLAAFWYRHPSRQLIVIGVTGTDGKTTTSWMIAQLLKHSGAKVGLSSTVFTMIGDQTTLNETHMTMPGRFRLQRQLRAMVDAGCRYAVIEMSSQGLAQNRHVGLDIDCAVITNLTPEHLESHGSFEAYRQAKGILFGQIIRSGDKTIDGQAVKKVTVVNLDDANAEFFLKYWAEEHHGVSLKAAPEIPLQLKKKTVVWQSHGFEAEARGMKFTLHGATVHLPYLGAYNILNALEAVAVATAYGVTEGEALTALQSLPPIPGRADRLVLPNGGAAVVDYALTPHALQSFYQALAQQGAKDIIGVFGAAGGGRDKWKRPKLGQIAEQYCSKIFLTTDDPDNEDPQKICDEILSGMSAAGRAKTTVILDRGAAIQQAVAMAHSGSVVAITGMGAETSMIVRGKKVAWSDVAQVKKILGA